MQALWTALIVVVLWFILNRHRFGEHVLFIGDSNAVSRVVGIDVDAREDQALHADGRARRRPRPCC